MPTRTITDSRVNSTRFVRKRPVSLWYWFFFINIVEVFNMAEENTATSSHLDSYMHVYDNGTTARLYVTPWDRNTVADGYWQTVNTIQPLINRDIYLADAIDKLAEKYTRYMPGYGINMAYNTVEDFWTISVDAEAVIDGIPKYNFNPNYFVTTPTPGVEGSQNVGLRFKNDSITADENGIYCNVEKLMHSTSSMSSYSSVSANTISSFSYDYKVGQADFQVVDSIPTAPNPNTNNKDGVIVYLVG